MSTDASPPGAAWHFLSNHGHVLVYVAQHPDARIREIADAVGVTERTVARILAELEAAGIVDRVRVGRRCHYHVRPDAPLRHPLESSHTVGELVTALADGPVAFGKARTRRRPRKKRHGPRSS
ncbi:MAG: MarR family transcriptional regulator [Deltaproteobacteria bacterium]|nr:MAG: MarR family transcriptional regulator [Deltaproteobacteria bacterium]